MPYLPFSATIAATMGLLGFFAVSCLVSTLLTWGIRHQATKVGVLDTPTNNVRKIHKKPIPLMGGTAVFLAIAITSTLALATNMFDGSFIRGKFLIGLLLAGLVLAIGGALDDRYNLRARYQLIFPTIAALIVIAFGIGIPYITNPFGGIIHLDSIKWTVLWWEGIPYKLTLFADIFAFAWLMGASYTTKILDGIDGLVAGTTVIGAIIIAAVSMSGDIAQPDTALLALIIGGAFLGFLLFNSHPASIFLGEGGSTLAGFLLGTLAIISGGKIATALLILGLPITDVCYTIYRRLRSKKGIASHDRGHLHHRLLDAGLTQRQVVLVYYLVAALFGTSTLLLEGWQKIIAIAAAAAMLPLLLFFAQRYART